jgi:hypothetical protein
MARVMSQEEAPWEVIVRICDHSRKQAFGKWEVKQVKGVVTFAK